MARPCTTLNTVGSYRDPSLIHLLFLVLLPQYWINGVRDDDVTTAMSKRMGQRIHWQQRCRRISDYFRDKRFSLH